MKNRCYLPSTRNFHRWGGRGIAVCERWLNSFENFLEDMGPCPADGTLDRINTDTNYQPSNCRWVTQREQMNNMSRNVVVEHNGKQQTIAEWARELGLKYATLHRRIVVKGELPPLAFRAIA
jgi:hypothetical protein